MRPHRKAFVKMNRLKTLPDQHACNLLPAESTHQCSRWCRE
jgi:hypothetical protein